jgi:hypothetical protein
MVRLIVRIGVIVLVPMFANATALLGFTVLDNFEHYGTNPFPTKWRARSDEARKIYRIGAENDNRFLRAHADKVALHIGLEHEFEPKRQQRLSWRWRVVAFPQGADERRADKHDAAAQVYVVFDSRYVPRVIKYVWSGSLPIGARFINPLYSRGRVIILRNGPSESGTWHQEEVNFYDDYRKLFGEEPGNVLGIGVLTSSDATKSLAGADYDDFILLP